MTAEEYLGKRDAVLIFKCADCGKIGVAVGYDGVHDSTGSQVAGETRQLFCPQCEREY